MKRLILLITIAVCCMSINAQTKRYVLNVGDFDELTVADNIRVNYTFLPDSAGYAQFCCEAALAPVITFSNTKRKLKIAVQSDTPVTGTLPVINVYSSNISKVTNLGDSLVNVLRLNPSDKFTAKVIGNGTMRVYSVYSTRLTAAVEAGHGAIEVDGTVQEAKYTIASVGKINASAVKANKVKCWMIGAGSVTCDVNSSLTLYGAGTGIVYYTGNPTIKKRSVGVKLEKIDKQP